jgi:predicted phage terminase large subunit-like protein
MIDNQMNKEVRIRRIGPYLAQRQMRFKARSPGTLLRVQQLKDFPLGDHDDGPDALEAAIRLAVDLWNGRHAQRSPTRLQAR